MENKMYSQEDIDTAKKIVSIDTNLNGLIGRFGPLEGMIQKMNESLPAIRNDLNNALSIAQNAKIIADGILVRVTALEALDRSKDDIKKGQVSIWKSYLAFMGGLVLTGGAIGFLINLIHSLQH